MGNFSDAAVFRRYIRNPNTKNTHTMCESLQEAAPPEPVYNCELMPHVESPFVAKLFGAAQRFPYSMNLPPCHSRTCLR